MLQGEGLGLLDVLVLNGLMPSVLKASWSAPGQHHAADLGWALVASRKGEAGHFLSAGGIYLHPAQQQLPAVNMKAPIIFDYSRF